VVVVVAVLSIGRPVQAEPASASWRTLETQHFRVHYPVELEEWARRATGAIERIHAEVTRYVGFAPTTPIDVIVEDPLAVANGVALPWLDRPVIILWTSPPDSDSLWDSVVDWPQLVLTHEFAHIAHLTRPRTHAWKLLRYLNPFPLGPLTVRTPRWLKEGYATVVEGALTGSGRPTSSARAMVLRRFAIEGKLPEYRQLSATRGWLGGTMAYLAGSAFLEWVEQQAGTGTLQELWRRLAARRSASFDSAFRAVYGKSPGDMYDRFRAELTARALAVESELKEAGLVEGDLWQRFDGGVSALQISPTGARLLARREPNDSDPYLAIWDIAETEAERREEARRVAREARRLRDPNEVPDRPQIPRRRKPRFRLPAINGSDAAYPRWMPDGTRVLYSHRSPGHDGVMHWDLAMWQPETGAVGRVTRLADVSMGDPLPDGHRAVAVRTRSGFSELVLVDLDSGAVTTVVPPDEDIVWTHPRASPDGLTIVALVHRDARWQLVRLPSSGPDVAEIGVAGTPVSPAAWSPDSSRIYFTTDASGIWNVHSAAPDDPASDRALTRVTGGAVAPAPTPDGRSIFFLELTAQGLDIRRVDATLTVTPFARPANDPFPILPPVSTTPARFPSDPVPPARPYRSWSTLTVRPIFSGTFGPDRYSEQVGVQTTDVLGRLNWLALVSSARESRVDHRRRHDRVFEGAATSLAYRGLAVALVTHAFVATERPGRHTFVKRPALDQRRAGAALSGSWRRVTSSGGLSVDAGFGLTSVESLSDGQELGRVLAFSAIHGTRRRTRGSWGLLAGFTSRGTVGRTDGDVWRQAVLHGQIGARTPGGRVFVSGRYGDTGGTPTRFDLFAIGGAPSSLVPPELESNRLYGIGLPAFLQVGHRSATLRTEYVTPRVPMTVYLERLGAWDPGSAKAPFAQAAGAELRIDLAPLTTPLHMPGTPSLYVGVARLRSETPRVAATRAYAGVVYRP
jgi:hypothetical protein